VGELMPCLLVIRRFSPHADTVFPFRQRDADGRRHGVAGSAGRESSVLATAVLLTHELQRLVVAKAVYISNLLTCCCDFCKTPYPDLWWSGDAANGNACLEPPSKCMVESKMAIAVTFLSSSLKGSRIFHQKFTNRVIPSCLILRCSQFFLFAANRNM
jgi:hypothetical protein